MWMCSFLCRHCCFDVKGSSQGFWVRHLTVASQCHSDFGSKANAKLFSHLRIRINLIRSISRHVAESAVILCHCQLSLG